MNKKIRLLCSILCVMCLLVGCGSSGSSGNVSITDDWQLVEMTVNGKTEKFKDVSPDSLAPQFSCTDGTNFTFSSNGKSHSGTLTELEGVYTLNYNDGTKTMKAKISGNRLTLTMADSDAMKLIFETK
ncbi:MAG: hypothetical protein K2G45_09460 [Lachnospiraceae bacterium]|nr:hypothetical protein [Lachnospiraceae bacterium]